MKMMVPSSSLPSAYSSVFSSSSVPSTSSGILSHSTGPTASFVQHTDDAPAGVSASSAPRPVNPTASSPSFPTAKELAPLEQHPLHKAWVGWRCLCFADAPPGTSSLVRMRVNETLSHVIGVHAERDSDTQSGVTTPREPLPSSRAEADGGSSAQEEGLPGGRDAGVFVERDDQTRKKSSLRDRGEEDDDREFWISARSGGERLAELVLLTQSIGGPFEDEILRFLGWHHAKCNLAFDDVLSQLEKERIEQESRLHVPPVIGESSSSVCTADGPEGPPSSGRPSWMNDRTLHAINKESLLAALRRFPSVKYFAESLKLEEEEAAITARLKSSEERIKRLRLLCEKARREKDLLLQEEETLKATQLEREQDRNPQGSP